MKEFEMRNVGSHIEVYTAGGVFLFSADTVREPWKSWKKRPARPDAEFVSARFERTNCKMHVK